MCELGGMHEANAPLGTNALCIHRLTSYVPQVPLQPPLSVPATPHNLAKQLSCAEWHAAVHQLLSRIYPAPLTLSLTGAVVTDPESPVLCTTGFLDIASSLLNDGTLHVALIRKEKKLPIPVCQYVQAESNRPLHSCYNVLVGLVMSAVWHNTASGPFLSDLLYICKKFVSNWT
jgi:hypothetical protein